MRKFMLVLPAFLFLCSCGAVGRWAKSEEKPQPSPSLKVRTITVTVIEDVASCKPLLDEKASRPQACGRCEIILSGKSLRITQVEECLRYEAYGCSTLDGKVFLINNLSCTPITESKEEPVKKAQKVAYRVRVVGEDCIAYIRTKKNVKVLYTRDYGSYIDVGVETDENTIGDIRIMGCVKSVEKE